MNFGIGIDTDDNDICSCGKVHRADIKEIIIQEGALSIVPSLVKKHGGLKAFIIADKNTFMAAGETLCENLSDENIPFSLYVFDNEDLKPDEFAVGQLVMHFDTECDFIIAVGSGTLNDIGKVLASITDKPYMIVGTAPSMDGFASATSSVIRDSIKVSLNTVCPTVIVADLDIMCQAPDQLLQAGIGDMLAKYISICEWRVSHFISGEYYCEKIAAIVRSAVKKCIEIPNLFSKEPLSIKPLIEGLIFTGVAMSFAGVSRPASGMEHYFSHIWDMRELAFNTPATLHGIQCGTATFLCLRIYEYITSIVPNRQKALDFVNHFSVENWNDFLVQFLGEESAHTVIELEKKEKKYDLRSHQSRLEAIVEGWDEIVKIISEELPNIEWLENYMATVGIPTNPAELGHPNTEVQHAFLVTKDIRDKYIGSRLLWDLGHINEAMVAVFS
ncbi:MAG: sn-glycerol-1-phosphate dehydrogenase [Clostridiaceae bacterium]|nr:sn-glycerol-1-phosphate dehydrogenase [Clostridiaceae bacterium]